MSIEYKDRGALHKLHKVGTPSKNILIKAYVKATLAAETTALFAKDAVTNRFVGKEFHVKFERRQSSSGKFKTHIKLVRADAPLHRPKGVFHKAANSGRFFEGDVPFRQKQNIRYLPKSKAGKAVYAASKFAFKATKKAAKATALTAETAVLKSTSFGINKFNQKLRNSSDTLDSGKAVLAGMTAFQQLNAARKYLIRYRVRRKQYKQLKQSFKGQKLKAKKTKGAFKSQKKSFKARKVQQRKKLKTVSKVYKAKPTKSKFQKLKQKQRIKKELKKEPKKKVKLEKKVYKNQKHLKKSLKKQKKKNRVVPIAALPLVPIAAGAKQLTASMRQKMLVSDPNNDALQAVDKSAQVVKTTVRTAKSVKKKLHDKSAPVYRNHLHKQENRLQQKKQNQQNPKKKKKKALKKNQKQSIKQKAQEAAKKAAKKTVKIVADFTKFAFKLFGILLLPILSIIIIFAILMLMFTGTAGNSSYILGTYNAQDKYLSQATEEYTKTAYEFNQKILKCKSDWKNGLSDFGVDTSSYNTTPNNYKFGKSDKFSQKPSYDFDIDKLAAFMCAYTYNFSDNEENVPNWEWDNSYSDVLKKLFEKEYTFKHIYEDFSGWKQLNSYKFFAGGGPNSSYWTVYSDGFSKDKMKIRNVPSEIDKFCKNGYLHYDYNSLEVLDANDNDKRTGYFIQDQRYIVKDPTGHSNNPFYCATTDKNGNKKYEWEHGVDSKGNKKYEDRSSWYWTSDNQQIYCVVNPTDTKKWNDSLDGVCLINFYQKNYWYEDCTLYYTVQKNCTFDEACKKVLEEKDKGDTNEQKLKDARLSFYKVLSEPQNQKGTKTYGNHQMLNAPVGGKSLQMLSGKIYNGYGYDIQAWNSEHCSITDCHKGVDFEAAKGAKVYAMCDGYINWIDESKHSISLMTSQDLEFWYDDNNKCGLEVIYTNIKTTLKQGDTVKQGQVIGTITDYKHCWDNCSNQKASKIYLHITLKISGIEVDPRYLIYRNESDGK